MNRCTYKAILWLSVMLLLTGCRNTTVSYGTEEKQMDVLEQRIQALEQQNRTLQCQITGLSEQAEILRQSLNEGREILLIRQQSLDETQNQLEQYEQDIGALKDYTDRISDILYGEFSYEYFLFRNEMDRNQLLDMGARAEMGILLAVTEEEGSLWVTMDPVVWTGKGEEGDWTCNETTDDVQTLKVAEETFYGIKEAYPVPMTAVQLREKMTDPYPPPFVFYIYDDEVYMIVEQYIP